MSIEAISGRAVVAVPGTPVPLGSHKLVKDLRIQALAANLGTVTVGGPSVVDEAAEHEGVTLADTSEEILHIDGPVDLARIFIDAKTANEGVSYMAVAS